MLQGSITLYAYHFKSRAERVIWTLQELDIPFELIRLDPRKGETQSPAFVALNPEKKVPVLVHDKKVLTESLAIMEYLNVASDADLIPNALESQYQYRHLLHFMVSEVESYLWIANQNKLMKSLYPWPEGSLDMALTLVRKNIAHVFDEVTRSDFAAGDAFSLADIYAYQIITWARAYGITPTADVDQWLAQMEARPAFPESMK